MQKILLTGSTGFIGKHFLNHLLQKKFQVRILLRDSQKASPFPNEIEIFCGDLTDPNSLTDACSHIDTVFHLGGYAHAYAEKNPSFANQHYIVNFQGTKNILEAAICKKVKKFIFFSSVKAVADSENCIDESWEKYPNSPYGIAKREAEKLVLNAKNTGIHVTILRPALVYGSEWKGNLASMLSAIDRGIFPPLPETNNRRSMIGVDDLCHAAILAATNLQANGKIYFVTDKIAYSTRELYVLMRQALGKRVPTWYIPFWFFKFLASIGDFAKKFTGYRLPFNYDSMEKLFGSAQYNSTRIELDLGFKPESNLEKMLPQIVAAYRKQSNKGI